MTQHKKTRIAIAFLALLLVAGGVAGWFVWHSERFSVWRKTWELNRKLRRLATECAESGRPMQFTATDRGEIRIADPVLVEDGRYILPATIALLGTPRPTLTRYDLVVFDDVNENGLADPEEPAWTWLEENDEGIPFDDTFTPSRQAVATAMPGEAAQPAPLHHPRFRLELGDSVTGTTTLSGQVLPLAKRE